jgi:hypothetical protein
MNWAKVGTHGMQSGEFRVAKNYVDGCTLYALYFKHELLKWCNSFDECKEVAETHLKDQQGREL